MDDFKNEYDDSTNVIVEINKNVEDTLYDEDKVSIEDDEMVITKEKKKKPQKNKKKFSFKNLTKKQKIIFIVSLSLIVLVIAFILVYFLVIKKDKKLDDNKEKPVIVEKDNYIYNNGTLKFLDKDDKTIGDYVCENKDENKCYVAYLTNENKTDLPVYLDEKESPLQRRSQIYNNKYVFVQDGDIINLYNITDKKKESTYKTIKIGSTKEGIVAYTNEKDKYGVLSISDEIKELAKAKYDYIDIYNSDNTFIAKEGSSYYLIKDDNKISKDFSNEISAFNDKFIVSDNVLYDLNGNKVINKEYDNILLDKDFVFGINSRKMTIYDNNLNKLNEEEIKLKSLDYKTSYIFDEKNSLKETKKPFEFTYSNGKITLTYDDKEKTINVYEGLFNSKLDFVNYFDGKLYFYSDEDKENLIGKYTCKNKNDVTSKTTELTNCFVAKESKIVNEASGYIPIFNSSYVFISDNNSVILYDLKNSKNLSEYKAVDTGIGAEKVTHVSALNSLVYCQNTSDGFGAITFGSNGPSGVIAFTDTKSDDPSGKTLSISFMKDLLLVKREKKNFLYDKIGNEIASSTFDIVDYVSSYMLVKNNDNYLVYSLKGNILSNEGKYIKLYDNYFALVKKDNSLNIYTYKDAKKGILDVNIQIKGTDASAFEISEDEKNYIVKVNSNNYTFDKVTGNLVSGDNNEE